MKKENFLKQIPIKYLYLISAAVVMLIFLGLYSTYAMFTTSVSTNNVVNLVSGTTYDYQINGTNNFSIGKNSIATFNVSINNTTDGSMYYEIYYSSSNNLNDVIIAEVVNDASVTTTAPNTSGNIAKEANKVVPLTIKNNSNETVDIVIGVVSGYVGQVINYGIYGYPTGTKITSTYNLSEVTSTSGCTREIKTVNEKVGDVYKNYEVNYYTCDKTLIGNNLDQSGANAPELADGMIPIMYNGSTWVKADKNNTNSSYKWYDYNNKMWANAVMVSDKVIKDKSNSNNNGLIYGNPTITNKEITFDGVDDYIDLGMANKTFSTNITLVARIKMLSGGSANSAILGNWETGGFGIFANNNSFSFNMYNTTATKYETVKNENNYALNTWYTVVGRYNGTELSLWIDGTKVASQNVLITPKISPMNLFIGTNSNVSGVVESGNLTMSDAMVYERALSDSEITALSSNIGNYPKSGNDNLLFAYDDFTSVNKRQAYMNASNGTEIGENDILAYYVWIPRYRYKLFNVEFAAVEPREIEIIFENTDEINNGTCGYYNNPTNNCYFSHPSFWWDEDSDGIRESGEELSGIWVGKFETSSHINCRASSYVAEGIDCNITTLNPRIKPGVTSWRGAMVSTFYNASKKIESTSYLTTAGVNNIDSI